MSLVHAQQVELISKSGTNLSDLNLNLNGPVNVETNNKAVEMKGHLRKSLSSSKLVNTRHCTEDDELISPEAVRLQINISTKSNPLSPSSKSTGSSKITIDDFELIRVVGKGSFGKVLLVRKRSSDKLFAMKILRKQEVVKRKQIEHTLTERRILEQIDHPYIVKLHYAFQVNYPCSILVLF